MKNLKELAANYNLYTLANIPATHKALANQDQKKFSEIPMALFAMSNIIEVGLFYECRTDKNNSRPDNHFIESSYILIRGCESTNLLVLRKERDGKYTINPFPPLLHKYHGTAWTIKGEVEKEITKIWGANKIGVFTESKVLAHVTFCDKWIEALDKVQAETDAKNEAIEKEIQDFIDAVTDCKVERYSNTVTVITRIFRVRFTHHKSERSLSTSIEFTGGLKDVQDITRLSGALNARRQAERKDAEFNYNVGLITTEEKEAAIAAIK